MDRDFQAIIAAAVTHSREQAARQPESLAKRIAEATPLDVDRVELAQRLRAAADRQG